MVEHHVEEDADVVRFGGGEEAIEVGEGAVLGVDGGVVGDVVAEVDLRGRIHGGDPDGVDAEGLEVVEARGDAVEVADAVAVGVLEAARVDLVDDGVLPPGGVGGGPGGGAEFCGRGRDVVLRFDRGWEHEGEKKRDGEAF